MRLSNIRVLVLGAVVISMVVAACGGATDPTSPSAPKQADAAPQATPTPTPPKLVSEGELIVALQTMAEFATMPDQGGGGEQYLTPMFDPIIGSNFKGDMDASQGFALEWSGNDDSTVWTIKTRPGVRFHNGDLATAADLAYLIEFTSLPGSKSGKAGPLRASYNTVEVPNAETVIVNLTGPDIFWAPNWLSMSFTGGGTPRLLIPGEYHTAVGNAGMNRNPIGSGPYRHVSTASGERIVQEAVDDHWLFGVPRIKTLNFWVVPEEQTRVAVLRNGEADMGNLARASIPLVREAGLRVFSRSDTSAATYMYMEQWVDHYDGYGKNPFSVLAVRQAMHRYAIDRQVLVDAFIGEGLGEPTLNYPILPLDMAYKPWPIPEPDAAKARQMIADAGWPDGFEIDMIIGPPNLPEGADLMEAIAVMFEGVGIKVNRKPSGWGTFRTELFGNIGKQVYSKPTIFGSILIFSGKNSVPFSQAPHVDGSPWVMNRDPEGFRLAKEWKEAPTIAEYIIRAHAYHDWEYENITTFEPILVTGDVFAGNEKIAQSYDIGRDAISFKIEYAAALQ
jgi:ABC-type transport system substrate-binding protein